MRCWQVALALSVSLTACGGVDSDTGLEARVRISGGQFYRGSLDKVSSTDGGLAVVDVINSQTVITPGLQNKQISGRLEPGSTGVAIGFAGDLGYWILPADVPDADSPTQPTFHASLSFSSSLSAKSYDLIVRAASSPDLLGLAAHVSLEVQQTLPPTGALVVSLWWDTESDLDLHVVDANGTEIWAGNINSYDRYATTALTTARANEGGLLDFDSNAACVIDGRCNENVVWSVTPPAGTYIARVDTYSLCGNSAARWSVEAFLNGLSLGKAEGESVSSSQRFTKGAGSGLAALSFTVPSP
jgi:hypothetical protein